MRAATPALEISDGQRQVLEVLSRSQTAPHRQVQRATALLLASEGVANTRIGQQVGVKPGDRGRVAGAVRPGWGFQTR